MVDVGAALQPPFKTEALIPAAVRNVGCWRLSVKSLSSTCPELHSWCQLASDVQRGNNSVGPSAPQLTMGSAKALWGGIAAHPIPAFFSPPRSGVTPKAPCGKPPARNLYLSLFPGEPDCNM